VKNDKVDAYRIALLFLLGEAVSVRPPREDLAEINILCRQYFRLSDDFTKYKNHLVSLVCIDSAILQSGKFKGSQVKISKRGSVFLRKVLYTAALASIRKKRNGDYFNPVLANYYECKIQSKPKNVSLVAVMHKLVRYIFAVLRDEKFFRLITPEEHLKAFEEARLSPLKMSA